MCDLTPTLLKDSELCNINRLTTLEIHWKCTRSKYYMLDFKDAPLNLCNFFVDLWQAGESHEAQTFAQLEDFDMYGRAGYFALDSLNKHRSLVLLLLTPRHRHQSPLVIVHTIL